MSAPRTLIPTGVRTPVVSMSMRALIGIVQALVTPGMRTVSFSSATSCVVESRSLVIRRSAGVSQPGAQSEYQVGTRRHWSRGLQRDHRLHHRQRRRVGGRLGATGLAEDAMPPRGTARSAAPASAGGAAPRVTDRPGSVVGMYRSDAFVQGRHELGAELLVDRHGGQREDDGAADDQVLPAQRPRAHRRVGADQCPADRMAVLRVDACRRGRR